MSAAKCWHSSGKEVRMSRIGRKPVEVPAGVEVKIDGNTVSVKGPKGELTQSFNNKIEIKLEGSEILITRPDDSNESKSLHGLTRTLVSNMVEGVTKGFSKTLEINGVGYRAAVKGNTLDLGLGFSHPVLMEAPAGITVEVPKAGQVVISGADKQTVGQFAAEIRSIRPPEPYKGKGIKYADEHIRRKEGKAGKGSK